MRQSLQVLAALLLAAVFAAPVAAVTPGGSAQETVTGIVETALVEMGDGRDHTVTTIRSHNRITEVDFEQGDASGLTGARVSLTGIRSGRVLRVTSANPRAGAVRVREAAAVSALGAWETEATGMTGASGGSTTTATVEAAAVAKSVAVVMFNFTDLRSTPYTRTEVANALVNSTASVRGFYEEESKGRMTLTGSVFGWYQLNVASTGCDWTTWHSLAWAAANAAGANLESYTNVAFVFPNTSACGWAGLGYVPGRYTYLNGNISVQVMTHELGHNFGLSHSNAANCTSDGSRVMIAATSACTSVVYADPFSTMGNNALRHNHGSHLGELGWLEAGEKAIGTPGNTYTITPYFGAAGLKLLRIPRGDGTFFDLDIRTPYGAFDTYSAGSPVTVGVTIRIGVGTASPTTTPKSSLLLDSVPDTADLKDAPLTVGRTMTDPVSNISITPSSIGAAGIVVEVRESIAPTTPGSLVDTAEAGRVTLSWSAATDNVAIAGYRVSRNAVDLATTTADATSWTDTAAGAGASYVYGVAAVDTSGNVGTATTRAVTVPGTDGQDPGEPPAPSAGPDPVPTPNPEPTPEPTPAPAPDPTVPPLNDAAAPTAPDQVTGEPTTTTVSLAWTPGSDDTGVVGYRVTRNGTLVASPTGQTWKDTARVPNTTYVYAVVALDGVGNTSSEASIAVRTLADTIRPTVPGRFRRIARAGAYVTFDWTASTDNVKVAKYAIYKVGRSTPIAVSKVSKIRIRTVRGAYYYARAIDSSGNRSWVSAKVRGRR
ncbi:MAG TPA: hypothetical protein VES19_06395 [Candidatus Limnocylindrales bacterium]|nr:hypothetical protein [Candidatus Limnocylindrales bacterium]